VERGKTYQEVLAERSQDLENGFETSASLGLCVKQFENGQRIEDLENMVCNDPPLRLPPLQCPQQSGSHADISFSFEEKESKEVRTSPSSGGRRGGPPHLPIARTDSFKSLPLPSPRTSTAALRRFSFPKVIAAPAVDIPAEVLLVEQSPRTAEIFI